MQRRLADSIGGSTICITPAREEIHLQRTCSRSEIALFIRHYLAHSSERHAQLIRRGMRPIIIKDGEAFFNKPPRCGADCVREQLPSHFWIWNYAIPSFICQLFVFKLNDYNIYARGLLMTSQCPIWIHKKYDDYPLKSGWFHKYRVSKLSLHFSFFINAS